MKKYLAQFTSEYKKIKMRGKKSVLSINKQKERS